MSPQEFLATRLAPVFLPYQVAMIHLFLVHTLSLIQAVFLQVALFGYGLHPSLNHQEAVSVLSQSSVAFPALHVLSDGLVCMGSD